MTWVSEAGTLAKRGRRLAESCGELWNERARSLLGHDDNGEAVHADAAAGSGTVDIPAAIVVVVVVVVVTIAAFGLTAKHAPESSLPAAGLAMLLMALFWASN
jgi:hypothetical protein